MPAEPPAPTPSATKKCRRCGAPDYGHHKRGKCPRCRAETSNVYEVDPLPPASAPAATAGTDPSLVHGFWRKMDTLTEPTGEEAGTPSDPSQQGMHKRFLRLGDDPFDRGEPTIFYQYAQGEGYVWLKLADSDLLRQAVTAQATELAALRAREEHVTELHDLDEWHEDDGVVLWWRLPVDEPPYCGTPLDSDWPGYHTCWTVIPEPRAALAPHQTTGDEHGTL